MASATVRRNMIAPAQSVGDTTRSETAANLNVIDKEIITASSTDTDINIEGDPTLMEALCIGVNTGTSVTVQFLEDATDRGTITLTAGTPFIWSKNTSYKALTEFISGAFNTVLVDNPNASPIELSMIVLTDPTN